jgi:Fur family ferric uptake transcriptional regulator
MKKRTNSDDSTDEDLRAALRKAGLRGTAPRLAVLRWMSTTRGPVSHAEAVRGLASARVVMDLADSRILRRTDVGDHVWRFELRAGRAEPATEHPHFVCTDCGEVSCLTGVAVEIQGAPSVPRAIRSRRVAVQLAGRCNACSQR